MVEICEVVEVRRSFEVYLVMREISLCGLSELCPNRVSLGTDVSMFWNYLHCELPCIDNDDFIFTYSMVLYVT